MSFFLGSAAQRAASPYGDPKCPAEVNSTCAEVLPAAKHSYGARAPLARRPMEWHFIIATPNLKISVLTVPPKQKATALAVASLFWVSAAGGDLYPLALQGSGRVKALPAAKRLYGVPAPPGGRLLERRQDPYMGGLEAGIGDFPQNRKMEFVRLRQRCEIERQNT